MRRSGGERRRFTAKADCGHAVEFKRMTRLRFSFAGEHVSAKAACSHMTRSCFVREPGEAKLSKATGCESYPSASQSVKLKYFFLFPPVRSRRGFLRPVDHVAGIGASDGNV